jgi:hypothetical protein
MDYAIESPCCVILMVLLMQMTEDALNFLRKETIVQAITHSSTKASYETGRMFFVANARFNIVCNFVCHMCMGIPCVCTLSWSHREEMYMDLL